MGKKRLKLTFPLLMLLTFLICPSKGKVTNTQTVFLYAGERHTTSSLLSSGVFFFFVWVFEGSSQVTFHDSFKTPRGCYWTSQDIRFRQTEFSFSIGFNWHWFQWNYLGQVRKGFAKWLCHFHISVYVVRDNMSCVTFLHNLIWFLLYLEHLYTN